MNDLEPEWSIARVLLPDHRHLVPTELEEWADAIGTQLVFVTPAADLEDWWQEGETGWLFHKSWLRFTHYCYCPWELVRSQGCKCGGE